MEGSVSTGPGVPYLSRYTLKYSNVYINPVILTCEIGSYFSAFNAIDNHNMMWKSDIVLDKYWVTQSDYFRLATALELGMGISDGTLLFCN